MSVSELFLSFHIVIFFGFLLNIFFLIKKLRPVSQYKTVRFYIVLLVILAIELFVTILLIISEDPEANSFLFGLFFFMFSVLAFFGFRFTRYFSRGFPKTSKATLWIFTVIYFSLAFVCSFLFRDALVDLNVALPIYQNFQQIQISYHPLSLIALIFPFILLIGSSTIIIMQFLEAGRKFQKFAFLIIGPYIFYVAITFLVFIGKVPELFMAPFFGATTSLILGYAVFIREKIYTIAPISRIDMMDYSGFGLVVLDSFGYIVDINPKARKILKHFETGTYRHIAEIFDQWNRAASLFEIGHQNVKLFFTTEFEEREAYFELRAFKTGNVGTVCMFTDVSDFKDLMDHLQYLAYHDKLTGLANRAMFEQGFEVLRKKAVQNNKNIAIMMIDMHGLKKVNEQYGHDKGDAVIKVFGTYLEAELPEDVILARLNGDEFVAAFYDQDDEELRKIGEKLLKKMHDDSSSEFNEILLDCSIGIACCHNVRDVKLRSVLMKRADTALFAAKKSDDLKIVLWDGNSALR